MIQEWWMVRDERMQGWRTSKIIGDDENELKSDDLYSDEDLTLHLLGNLNCDLIEAMFENNNMGIRE